MFYLAARSILQK